MKGFHNSHVGDTEQYWLYYSTRPNMVTVHAIFVIHTRHASCDLHTAVSINVVGSKCKAIRQDLKILWIFFVNKFIKIIYASSVQWRYKMASHLEERNVRISNGWGGSLFEDDFKLWSDNVNWNSCIRNFVCRGKEWKRALNRWWSRKIVSSFSTIKLCFVINVLTKKKLSSSNLRNTSGF